MENEEQDLERERRIGEVIQKLQACYEEFSEKGKNYDPKDVTVTMLRVAMQTVYDCAPNWEIAYGGILQMNEYLRDIYIAKQSEKSTD